MTSLATETTSARGRGRNDSHWRLPGRYVIFALVCVIAFATSYPLVWMMMTALKTEAAIAADPLSLLPASPQPQNFVEAWRAIQPFFINSVLLAVLSVSGVLVVSSLAGYAFARLDFPGKSIAFLLILATAIVPNIVYILPQYLMFQRIGWIDTFYPLWVPRAMTPVFGTFLMRQAFMTLPRELEEAGLMDGANRFQIFLLIMLPQTAPALAAVAIFTFIESWNDLLGPLIFVNSIELQTLPLALAQFQGQFFTTVSTLMAASTITVAPVIILYLVAQRYFVEGITTTGLK